MHFAVNGLSQMSIKSSLTPRASRSLRENPGHSRSFICRSSRLDVEVQRKLPWVWSQTNCVDFILSLVVHPGAYQVGRKHVALQQEPVVHLQGIQHFLE